MTNTFPCAMVRWLVCVIVLCCSIPMLAEDKKDEAKQPDRSEPTPPVELTTQADHKRLMELLGIKELRRGANGNDRNAPNAANYDEAKAKQDLKLPDPLLLKNGEKVTTAEVWKTRRRPEIVEDFDREIYGRVPKVTPAVKWEIAETSEQKVGETPVIAKKLVGHVDNSAYPLIKVDIQLTLTTPANAKGPVPVIMEFGFGGFGGRAFGPPPGGARGPTWQEQLIAKGWGYAIIVPNSIQADNGAGLTRGIIGLGNKGQPRQVDDWGALRAWAWGAGPVYKLLGQPDLGTAEFPPQETALIDGTVAFRQHGGGHTAGPNWPTFLQFAERFFKEPAGND